MIADLAFQSRSIGIGPAAAAGGFLASFAVSWAAVAWLRRWALRRALLDIPNPRSSHRSPVPRGGGLAIAAVVLTATAISLMVHPRGTPTRSLLVFGVILAVIGSVSWIDDLRSLSSTARLLVQASCAAVALATMGSFSTLSLPRLTFTLGLAGPVISFLWIVGLTNAYNFMDGIDGIAGGQGLVAGVGWAVLGYRVGEPFLEIIGVAIAGSCAGFLLLNWHPARIFMGDVGSALLGMALCLLPIIASPGHPELAVAGPLLVWPFVLDPLFTFFRRLWNREPVLTAHRSHLYQRLVISGLPHPTVSVLYMALAAVGLAASIAVERKSPWAAAFLILVAVLAAGLYGLVIIRERRGFSNASTAGNPGSDAQSGR